MKDLICKKEKNKWYNIIKQCKKLLSLMTLQKNIKEHNSIWLNIPEHSYRILIVGGSGSAETKSWFNLMNHQHNIDKMYLYAKDSYGAKYQFLIKKQENTCLNHLNDSRTFTEYSKDMDDIYKNIEEYNSNKERKILTVFDDLIVDMLLIQL